MARTDEGWTRLVPQQWIVPSSGWGSGSMIGSVSIVVFAIVGGDIADGGGDGFGVRHWVGYGIGAVVGGFIGAALSVLVGRLRFPETFVDDARTTLRIGRRTLGVADVTRARLLVDTRSRRSRPITLVFGADRGPRVSVVLRNARGNGADERTRALLVDVLRRTAITMPTTSRDPSGRFARFTFPYNVSREDAVAAVEHPPALGDPLPISDPR